MTHSDSPIISHRPIKFGSPWNIRKTIEVEMRGNIIAEASAVDYGEGLSGFVLLFWEREGEIIGTAELHNPNPQEAIVFIDTLLMSLKRETEDAIAEGFGLLDQANAEKFLKEGK